MAGGSAIAQEPTAIKTRNPFRDASFPPPDEEKKGTFFFGSLVLFHIVKPEFFIEKILHKAVHTLNPRRRLEVLKYTTNSTDAAKT